MGALTRLHKISRHGESEPVVEWVAGVKDVLVAIDESAFVVPRHWAHLKRSARAAIGEATCLAFADRYRCGAEHQFRIEPTWLGFAEEYFAYVIQCVGTWREHYSNDRANEMRVLDFDTWLRATRRYETGVGLWPDEARDRL
jgi:hypothetical protein